MGIHFKIAKQLEHFAVEVEASFDKGVMVIQGESGAGKTTLLNCIAGLDTPDKGEIIIDESLVFEEGKCNIPARQRGVGYLFQNYALFPHLSVKSNIIYGIKNKSLYRDKHKREEALEFADDVMKSFGIDKLKGRSPLEISGGERQRAALARVIVTKPRLLLLDEPFSALDEATRKDIYCEFEDIKERFDIPVVLITHNSEEAERFGDLRFVMKKGRFI